MHTWQAGKPRRQWPMHFMVMKSHHPWAKLVMQCLTNFHILLVSRIISNACIRVVPRMSLRSAVERYANFLCHSYSISNMTGIPFRRTFFILQSHKILSFPDEVYDRASVNTEYLLAHSTMAFFEWNERLNIQACAECRTEGASCTPACMVGMVKGVRQIQWTSYQIRTEFKMEIKLWECAKHDSTPGRDPVDGDEYFYDRTWLVAIVMHPHHNLYVFTLIEVISCWIHSICVNK